MKKRLLLFVIFLMVINVGYHFSGPVLSESNDSHRTSNSSGVIEISGKSPMAVPALYGQNYWCWDAYGDEVQGTEARIRALHLNFLRAGGYNNDAQSSYGFDPFTRVQVSEFVNYCRSVGAEPILQVSLLKNAKNRQATAEDAASWVRYCNIEKKLNIRYWSIGNEPDIYVPRDKSVYTVNDFCRDFRQFSRAMKEVDPTIKILGPELTAERYYPHTGDDDWLTPFLVQCKGDFDILTLHRYPFNAKQCTISNALQDGEEFRSVIRGVRNILHEQNLDHIPLGITEANVTWDGNPSHSNTASPPTYYAGLWLADSIGVALEENLWTMAYWSICEGWPLGFLEPGTKNPRPIYYVFQMFSTHFGPTIIHPVTIPDGFSVFASRNASNDRTILMVINKNDRAGQTTIKFSDFEARPVDREYGFPAYSVTCLSVPDHGDAVEIWSYTKDMFERNIPPQKIK